MGALLGRELVRENPFWCLVLTGRPTVPEHEVEYLAPTAFDTLRERVGVVRPRLGSLLDVLGTEPDESVDAVDLLDVPAWLSSDERRDLWAEVGRILRPGGRCLGRSISRRPELPGPLGDLTVDEPLSSRLTAIERTAVYGAVTVLRKAPTRSGHAQ